MIGHEEGVELAALQGLGVGDQGLEVEVGVRGAAGITPGGGMDADRAHEGAEAELLAAHVAYLALAGPSGKAFRTTRSNPRIRLSRAPPGAQGPGPGGRW